MSEEAGDTASSFTIDGRVQDILQDYYRERGIDSAGRDPEEEKRRAAKAAAYKQMKEERAAAKVRKQFQQHLPGPRKPQDLQLSLLSSNMQALACSKQIIQALK